MRNKFFGNGEIQPGRRLFVRRSGTSPLPAKPESVVEPVVHEIGELVTEDILTVEQTLPAAEEEIQEIILVEEPEILIEEPQIEEQQVEIVLEEAPKKKRGRRKKTSTV